MMNKISPSLLLILFAMASDSSPVNLNNGPSSPDDSSSSPIANTSSPAHRRRSGRRQTAIPSSSAATPRNISRVADSETTPTPSRSTKRGRRLAISPTHAATAPTPQTSTDDFPPPSSEGGDDMEEAHDVFSYDSDLYNKIMRYPLEVLTIFDIFLMDIVSLINPSFDKHVQVRIHNLKSSTSMRNLNPSDIEKMISLKGMVIRCSSIIPEIREAVFRCTFCGYHSELVVVDRGNLLLNTSKSIMCLSL